MCVPCSGAVCCVMCVRVPALCAAVCDVCIPCSGAVCCGVCSMFRRCVLRGVCDLCPCSTAACCAVYKMRAPCSAAGGHLPVPAAAAAVPHAAAVGGAAPTARLAQSGLVSDSAAAGARDQPGSQSATSGCRRRPHATTRLRGESDILTVTDQVF